MNASRGFHSGFKWNIGCKGKIQQQHPLTHTHQRATTHTPTFHRATASFPTSKGTSIFPLTPKGNSIIPPQQRVPESLPRTKGDSIIPLHQRAIAYPPYTKGWWYHPSTPKGSSIIHSHQRVACEAVIPKLLGTVKMQGNWRCRSMECLPRKAIDSEQSHARRKVVVYI